MKNVIVFKKLDEDDKYKEELLKNDFNPTFIPVLEHTLDNLSEIREILYDGPQQHGLTGLILTSQRSVEAIEACIQAAFQSSVAEEWNKLPVYVVGAQTAKALSHVALFKNSHSNWIIQPKALDLVECFPRGENQKFLFLAGDKRRDVIPQALEKLNLAYREIMSYSTCIHPKLKSTLYQSYQERLSIDWLVLFSPSGLQFILNAIQDNTELLDYYFNADIKIASVGPTTTEFVLEMQRRLKINPSISISTAEKPDSAHLIKAMTRRG